MYQTKCEECEILLNADYKTEVGFNEYVVFNCECGHSTWVDICEFDFGDLYVK